MSERLEKQIKAVRQAIMLNRDMSIIRPLNMIVDMIEEAAIGVAAEDTVSKAEVQETLAEVKVKVDDLMDDGKLNNSNKTKKAKAKK